MYTQPNLRILYNSVNWGWQAILISLKLISHKNGFGKDILPEIILFSIILNFLGLYISFSLLEWMVSSPHIPHKPTSYFLYFTRRTSLIFFQWGESIQAIQMLHLGTQAVVTIISLLQISQNCSTCILCLLFLK